ncbi:hypothetical protein FACS189427_08330 [Planctomycetales bacterium]|nr:hypothetical protein FACS189427_08330 [Planctomycetales bacterium]
MTRFITVILFFVYIPAGFCASPFDCLWGGQNEETSYTVPFVNGLNGRGLSQNTSNMNLGAPPAGIPVQATPQTQAGVIPQTTVPVVSAQSSFTNGGIGTVGQPATVQTNVISAAGQQLPPGTEIIYVRQVQIPADKECQNGVQRTSAVETEIVPANTPGAIPVALRTMTVTVPKVERRWSYSPIKQKTEKLVEVVNPRTGKVVKTYCDEEEHRSILPWLHLKESITYETVEAKVAVPVKL